MFVTGKDRVIPFAMEFVGLEMDTSDFFIRDLAPHRVLAVMQPASHG